MGVAGQDHGGFHGGSSPIRPPYHPNEPPRTPINPHMPAAMDPGFAGGPVARPSCFETRGGAALLGMKVYFSGAAGAPHPEEGRRPVSKGEARRAEDV